MRIGLGRSWSALALVLLGACGGSSGGGGGGSAGTDNPQTGAGGSSSVDGGSGIDGSAGSSNNGVETCTQALCPMGGHTYRYCSAPHAASCRYLGSDGTIFNCVSCSNCVAAADEVSSWCATGQDPTGNTSGNYAETVSGGAKLFRVSRRI